MPATPPRSDKLSWWIDHRLNILFRGRHGVGKTEIVRQAFERAGLRWRRFSSQRLTLEQIFEDASVDALFFDDLERMFRKLRSVVLDLVGNGSERLPELKVVWAAVSVVEDDFDELETESVEPFDMTVEIPFKPHLPYFTEVFGAEVAEAVALWWEKLPEEMLGRVSPRALEEAVRKVVPGAGVESLNIVV